MLNATALAKITRRDSLRMDSGRQATSSPSIVQDECKHVQSLNRRDRAVGSRLEERLLSVLARTSRTALDQSAFRTRLKPTH